MVWATEKKTHLVCIGSTKLFLQVFLQPCSSTPTWPQEPSHSNVNSVAKKMSGASHCHVLCTDDHSPSS